MSHATELGSLGLHTPAKAPPHAGGGWLSPSLKSWPPGRPVVPQTLCLSSIWAVGLVTAAGLGGETCRIAGAVSQGRGLGTRGSGCRQPGLRAAEAIARGRREGGSRASHWAMGLEGGHPLTSPPVRPRVSLGPISPRRVGVTGLGLAPQQHRGPLPFPRLTLLFSHQQLVAGLPSKMSAQAPLCCSSSLPCERGWGSCSPAPGSWFGAISTPCVITRAPLAGP